LLLKTGDTGGVRRSLRFADSAVIRSETGVVSFNFTADRSRTVTGENGSLLPQALDRSYAMRLGLVLAVAVI